jgi:hypothetical protein
LRLGFDAAGRLFAVVVLRFDDGDEVLIHAMRARRAYLQISTDQRSAWHRANSRKAGFHVTGHKLHRQ